MSTPALSVEIRTNTEGLIARANGARVTNQDEYTAAEVILVDIQAIRKKIVSFFAEPVRKAFEAHKAIKDAANTAVFDVGKAETSVKKQMTEYTSEQDHIRTEAKRKADEETARIKKQQEDFQIASAAKAEQDGDTVLAEQILSVPMGQAVPALVATVPPLQSEHFSTRENWKARVVDIKLLCAAVAEGRIDQEAVTENLVTLNSLARACRAEGTLCPGVECYNDLSLAAKKAADSGDQ